MSAARFDRENQRVGPRLAMEAGFRSKNGFYSAFHKVIGLTPTEFRQLPVPRARQIVESVKASLLQRVPCRQDPDLAFPVPDCTTVIGRVFVSRRH